MRYDYTATNKRGEMIRGSMVEESPEIVATSLRNQGFVPVSVSRHMTLIDRALFALEGVRGGIDHAEKEMFTKHLSLMLRSGLTLAEALDILIDQARAGRFRGIIRRLRDNVTVGQSFTNSVSEFPRVFPNYYVSIVEAGETAGTLDDNLTYLAVQMNKENELRKKVKSAMLYPTIVMVAGLVIGYFFSIFVIPQVAELFAGLKGVQMPWYTRAMLFIANFTKSNPISTFIGLFGGLWVLIWFLRRRFLAPVTHWLALHLPVVSRISHDINLARMTMVTATMLKAGLDIITATDVSTKVVGNYYYRVALQEISEQMTRGDTMSEVLAKYDKLFPPVVTRMVAVGERTGKLEEVLEYLTEFYQLEVETTMKNLTTILEPVLLLLIGGMALVLALSILMPIYNYISSIRMI